MAYKQLPPEKEPSEPPIVTIVAITGMALLFLPLLGLLSRVDTSVLPSVLSDPSTVEMLQITLVSAVLATIITVFLGVPMALWLRSKPEVAAIIRFFIYLPLAMPPVVAGLALTSLIGRRGLLAPMLDAVGFHFAFSFAGVVAAHSFIALPFVVITIDSALRSLDREIFNSAAALGLSPGKILSKLSLPLLRPAIITSVGLAFARSLGEFGTTITFAGSLPGETRTLPIGVYLLRENDPTRAYVLAMLLILVAICSLALTALPELLRRQHRHQVVEIDETTIDAVALRKLCQPLGTPPTITINSNRDPIELQAGICTALVGPNGSGKSTLAALLAGRFKRDDIFRITFSPAPAQPVMLTQNPALPPHYTVGEAVGMVSAYAKELLTSAGLGALYSTPIPQLSGGQAAQVALIRALATKPEVLILDEPLAAIDIESANRWRSLLQTALDNRTVLLISHNPVEVGALAQKVIALSATKIQPAMATAEFFTTPPNQFAADFIGLNRIECTAPTAVNGLVEAQADDMTIVGLAKTIVSNRPIALFSPYAVTVATKQPTASSARNCWAAEITSISNHDGIAKLGLTAGRTCFTAVITQQSLLEQQLGIGDSVYCTVKAVEISFH